MLSLIVARRAVRKFAPGVSAEEALRDRSERLKAVQMSVYDVGVNERDSEEWSQQVRDRLRQLGGGGFELRIIDKGVELVEEDQT